jgi:mRNA-degrading endonuclease RelE of RelBE toxin-antitoxin system
VSKEVVWSGPAQRDLRRLPPDVARRVIEAVLRFAGTGHGDVRPLQGYERQWRLRVGDMRVLFTYSSEPESIQVYRVLPRGRAYR